MAENWVIELLSDPDAFFAARTPTLPSGQVLVVVAVVVLGTAISFGVVGWVFTHNIDAGAVSDGAASPSGANGSCGPDGVHNLTDDSGLVPSSCAGANGTGGGSEPTGPQLWAGYEAQLPVLIVSTLFQMALIGLLLHAFSAGFEGEGALRDTLSVAVYGYLPTVIGSAIAAVGAVVFVYGMGVETTASTVVVQVQSFTNIGPNIPSILFHGVIIGWQGLIWTYGVAHARDLSVREAGIIAAPVTMLVFVTSLI